MNRWTDGFKSSLCLWKTFQPWLSPLQTTIQHCRVSLTCWGEPGSWKTFLDFLIWRRNIFHGPSSTLGSTTAKDTISGKSPSLPPQPVHTPQGLSAAWLCLLLQVHGTTQRRSSALQQSSQGQRLGSECRLHHDRNLPEPRQRHHGRGGVWEPGRRRRVSIRYRISWFFILYLEFQQTALYTSMWVFFSKIKHVFFLLFWFPVFL